MLNQALFAKLFVLEDWIGRAEPGLRSRRA